jgi:hypothetical protein
MVNGVTKSRRQTTFSKDCHKLIAVAACTADRLGNQCSHHMGTGRKVVADMLGCEAHSRELPVVERNQRSKPAEGADTEHSQLEIRLGAHIHMAAEGMRHLAVGTHQLVERMVGGDNQPGPRGQHLVVGNKGQALAQWWAQEQLELGHRQERQERLRHPFQSPQPLLQRPPSHERIPATCSPSFASFPLVGQQETICIPQASYHQMCTYP